MSLTREQFNAASAMRAQRKPFSAIGLALGVRASTVRFALHPDRQQAVYEARKFKRRRLRKESIDQSNDPIGRQAAGLSEPQARDIPAHVLFDRDRRMMASKTLTAALLGDPEPGRVWADGRPRR